MWSTNVFLRSRTSTRIFPICLLYRSPRSPQTDLDDLPMLRNNRLISQCLLQYTSNFFYGIPTIVLIEYTYLDETDIRALFSEALTAEV